MIQEQEEVQEEKKEEEVVVNGDIVMNEETGTETGDETDSILAMEAQLGQCHFVYLTGISAAFGNLTRDIYCWSPNSL